MTTHSKKKIPEFQKIQYDFAAHIRNPKKNSSPNNIEDRRMKIYSELFYNNVEDFMSTTYPVLCEILGSQRWHALIHDYYEHHKSSTPLFPEMPREFLVYLENERQPQDDDFPFMNELAHYEWIELSLSISELNNDATILSNTADYLNEVPVISKLAWLLTYQFPVHQIRPDYLPTKPNEQATHIVASRLQDEDTVNFTEINPVIGRLLQLVAENDKQLNGQQLLKQIANELKNPDIDAIINFGLQTLVELQEKNIIIGTIKQ